MLEKKGEWARKNAARITGLVLLALLILILAVHFLGKDEKNAATLEARVAFLSSLGWEVDPGTEEAGSVKIPSCEEGAMADYNALMQMGGYDLSPYEGKSVEQYLYQLKNYPNCAQTVWVTLYVYDGCVIGGDIHTAALDGFMHELRARD